MTSPCTVNAVELGRFWDGEIASPAEQAKLESHIGGCEQCRLRLAELEQLGQLLVDQRAALEERLPADFSARVLAVLPSEVPGRGWLADLRAFGRAQRTALSLGLAAAVVAISLAIVFAPALRHRDGTIEEAAENEAQIHRLEVTSPDQSAVVLQSAEGNTVIWMVPASETASDGDAGPNAVGP